MDPQCPHALVLLGEDSFLRGRYLKQHFANAGQNRTLQRYHFDLPKDNWSEVQDLCNSMSLMGDMPYIQISLHKVPTPEQQKQMLAYFQNPSTDAFLVLLLEKLDKRIQFSKQLQKVAKIVACEAPKLQSLGAYLRDFEQELGLQLDMQARQILIENIGADLSKLHAELEKLKLYAYPKTQIVAADVTQLVMKSSEEDIFQWLDAVFEGKSKAALEKMIYLLRDGAAPIAMTALLARHLRILFKAKEALDLGLHRTQLASHLAVPPFVVAKYLAQAKRFGTQRLQKLFSALAVLDTQLKSSSLPPNMLMERWISHLLF